MAYLSFISDEDLCSAVNSLIIKTKSGIKSSKNETDRNVLDPFSLFFQMACSNVNFESVMTLEKTRQAQKTLTNSIGQFHQDILGSVKDWKNLGKGGIVDLCCPKQKILAEIKNKHNTVKGSDLKDYYNNLEELVMHKGSSYHGYIAYFVEIIPHTPERFNKCFTPSDNRKSLKKRENENIRKCDGQTFYHLVTGAPDALLQLYKILPIIVEKMTKKKPFQSISDQQKLNEVFMKSFGLESSF